MNRDRAIARIHERAAAGNAWDLVVIGGGATGLGIAVDASARGHATLLIERDDFGSGTSSRSTKLLHGGVRYLAQGNVSLVREALRERDIALANAPHLTRPIAIVVPCRSHFEKVFYRSGLLLYDRLAGRSSLPASRGLSASRLRQFVPGLAERVGDKPFVGGVLYHDGQFEDARLALALARTAWSAGACVVNHAEVVDLMRTGAVTGSVGDNGKLAGVVVRDRETGDAIECLARVIVNATGPFADAVRRIDDPRSEAMIAPSQGVHLVLPDRFLPGATGVIVPRTPDGRVIFALPWRDRVIVGTTDTPLKTIPREPRPLESEIAFLLELCGRYLANPPARSDVLAVFTGVRPLVRGDGAVATSRLSRDHSIQVSASGLVTITGGKWTTYRRMAEETVDLVERLAGLGRRACTTRSLRLHGCPGVTTQEGQGDAPTREPPAAYENPADDHLSLYGTDASIIRAIAEESPSMARPIHPQAVTSAAEVVFAVREEMARTVEDVLARRTRDLVVDARVAWAAAPVVAELLATEIGRDATWVASQVNSFRAAASASMLREMSP